MILVIGTETKQYKDALEPLLRISEMPLSSIEEPSQFLQSLFNQNPKVMVFHDIPINSHFIQMLNCIDVVRTKQKPIKIYVSEKIEERKYLSQYFDYMLDKAPTLNQIQEILKEEEKIDTCTFDFSEKVIKRGDLSIDLEKIKVLLGNYEINLTITEFRLLQVLISENERVLSRQYLCKKVLGSQFISERTIDVHIYSLRKKLDSYGNCIKTIRGVGYRFTEHQHEIHSELLQRAV